MENKTNRPSGTSATPPTLRRLWALYALAAAAFIPAVAFYYVGEEAIFPITSLEMWFHGEWLVQLLYGSSLQHNPLFNWLIIPVASTVGWEYMLVVARLWTISATVSTGLVLAWLATRLFDDRRFGAFTAVVYLMLADLTLYRGWLAYVDPLYAFFVFSSIACLWVACHERRPAVLALAVAALTLAFLSKAFTAYVFYGVAVVVLLIQRDYRRLLLSPASLLIHLAGVSAAWIWLGLLPAHEGQGWHMFREIVEKLDLVSISGYLVKLVAYPAETLLKLTPAVFVAVYYAWKGRGGAGLSESTYRSAVAIAFLNYLPYWLAPQSHSRYLVPLYPLAALIFAHIIWRARPASLEVTLRWFYGLLALKLAFVLVLFPYYQKTYRGENYAMTAAAILQRTAGYPLYSSNTTASGLSVAGYVDVLRLPQPPLVFPPAQGESGFVIAYRPDPAWGKVTDRYRLGGDMLYLMCRGAACQGANNDNHQAADTAGQSK